jgi:3-oxoacyl-[acyl-carrier protein] reductase
MNEITKKKVLITGGNKGIGLAVTEKFLREGRYDITVLARDFTSFPGRLRKSVNLIEFDLADTDGIPRIAEEIGDIEILVNNAGLIHALPYDKYTSAARRSIIGVNIEAPVALITAFSGGMIRAGGGRIVNVASIAGRIGHPDIWYGITKAGVINMTQSFAKILGSGGVIVNCVAPGPTATDFFARIPEERKESVLSQTVLKRPGEPREVADTIFWLAAESPEYINGICVDITNSAT